MSSRYSAAAKANKSQPSGSETPGRVVGFSKLINEKTMLEQKSELDLVLDEFCGSLPSEELQKLFEEKKVFASKFLREAFNRLKHNQFHLTVEESFIATNAHDLLFASANPLDAEDYLDVYLNLRRPTSLKVLNASNGLTQLQVPPPPKPEEEKLDVLDCLRCSRLRQRRLLSSQATTHCIHQLLISSRSDLLKVYNNKMLQMEIPTLHAQECAVYCTIRCLPAYLSYTLAAPPPGRKTSGSPSNEDEESSSNEEENADQNGDTEEDEESNDSNRDPNIPDPTHDVPDRKVIRRDRASIFQYREIRLRIFPGYCLNQKEKTFLLGRPYPWTQTDLDTNSHLQDESMWRTYATYRETLILNYAFKADKATRHRAWKIITELCAREKELEIIQREHVKQSLLHHLEFEVDHQSQWQRQSLSTVVQEVFFHLRDALQKRSFEHYFVEGLNLFENVDNNLMSKAMVRCSVLGKSRNVLCSTVKRALKERFTHKGVTSSTRVGT